MTTSTINQNVVPTIPSAYYGVTAGISSAYTISPTSLAKVFAITFALSCAASPTLSIGGGVAINLLDMNGVPLTPGALIAGETRVVADNGSSFIVMGVNQLSNTQIQPVTATVSANALTVSLAPTQLQFRSATLTTGVPNTRNITSTLSLVVPSSATLGTVNGVAARFAVLVLDVSSTVQELALINMSGGNNLDETGVISTTAISTAATAANVIYSTTARTGVAYRVAGFVDNVQAAAGTYASAPTLVQGTGGEAFSAFGSIGYGQSIQNLTASRALGVTYYNTTGRPIHVYFEGTVTTGNRANLTVNGQLYASVLGYTASDTSIGAIVPPGGSYVGVATGSGTLAKWLELR